MIVPFRQTISRFFSSFREARREEELSFWLIATLACYSPFEDIIAAWLPVPRPVRTLFRFIPEIILYSIFVRVIYQRLRSGEGIRKTPIDIPVAAVFISAACSILVNGASPPGSIANLRTNWRYLAMYYSLVNLDFTHKQVKNLIKAIKTVGIVQGVLASIQFFLPTRVNIAFAAGHCSKAEHKGASCGTFLDSAILSGFLIVAAIVALTRTYAYSGELIPGLRDLFNTGLVYFGLFASKKRAALLVGLFVPFLVFLFLKRRRNLAIATWVAMALGSAAFFFLSSVEINAVAGVHAKGADSGNANDITSYFGTIFTKEYWERTFENSRGWTILVTTNALMRSGKWWFGFGPELGSVRRGIEVFLNPEDQFQLLRNLYVFDDPFWFAIAAYFGVVGLLLYWLVLWQLYRASREVIRAADSEEEKATGAILRSLTVVAFLYSFVERLFRLRPFSFYFWLFAGLAMSYYCRQRERSPRELR